MYNASTTFSRLIRNSACSKCPICSNRRAWSSLHSQSRRVSDLCGLRRHDHLSLRNAGSTNSRRQAIGTTRAASTIRDHRSLDTDAWCRMPQHPGAISIRGFVDKYDAKVEAEQTLSELVTVRGRIWTIRRAGGKLAFIDLWQNGKIVQIVLEYKRLQNLSRDSDALKDCLRTFQRGDIISMSGHPHRTARGELSVLATYLPEMLSPSLHRLPEEVTSEFCVKNRHIDFLLHETSRDQLKRRSIIIHTLRRFLEDRDFMEVQTPILADRAEGAIARAFQTKATEFEDRPISLRIAPELWLKRLVVGGFDRIFELGPSFRNEGLDLTHNPEFWTCEFYAAYLNLADLINLTETLLRQIGERLANAGLLNESGSPIVLPTGNAIYPKLDFITNIEKKLGMRLPDLDSPNAEANVRQIFVERNFELPPTATLPRLLDRLSARYLEQECHNPTWIINHPECLSPLAKSFRHPHRGHLVSARGELFIRGQEIINTYEEENCPGEQRRKFESQSLLQSPGHNPSSIDESYLNALKYGMPPTGGWGCGIERLCMIFGQTKRIADTMAFGNLKNVISLSST